MDNDEFKPRPVPTLRRKKRATLTRAAKLAQLGHYSKEPAETLREQCPAKVRLTFHLYHWDKQGYYPLPAAAITLVVRNVREFARLRKQINDLVLTGTYMDEKNESKADPPSLERQLDPTLHRDLPDPLGRDKLPGRSD